MCVHYIKMLKDDGVETSGIGLVNAFLDDIKELAKSGNLPPQGDLPGSEEERSSELGKHEADPTPNV